MSVSVPVKGSHCLYLEEEVLPIVSAGPIEGALPLHLLNFPHCETTHRVLCLLIGETENLRINLRGKDDMSSS
jgi:hypothetical protein